MRPYERGKIVCCNGEASHHAQQLDVSERPDGPTVSTFTIPFTSHPPKETKLDEVPRSALPLPATISPAPGTKVVRARMQRAVDRAEKDVIQRVKSFVWRVNTVRSGQLAGKCSRRGREEDEKNS